MSNRFDSIYGIDDSMAIVGATPSPMAAQLLHNERWISSRYDVNLKGTWYYFDVSLDKTSNGIPIIMLKNGADIIDLSYSAYDVYTKYRCDDNLDLAANWESDLALKNYLAQKQAAIQHQQMIAMQSAQQGWSYQSQHQSYQGYPKPSIDIDFLLENTSPKDYLPLDTCIYDKDSLISQLPAYISYKTDIPPSTIMMLTLSVFSALTSKRYQCAYKDGRVVTIGLYSVLEQCSGAGKSLALGMLLEPLTNMIKPRIAQLKLEIESYELILDELYTSLAGRTKQKDKANDKELIAEAKVVIKKLNKKLTRLLNLMPITNSTPEALDAMLSATYGFFFAAAAEMGLFNSMLGLSYGSKNNNNDLLLNAREGADVNSNRVGRKSYSGRVIGAVSSFAQYGSIEKLLLASNVSGLAERFLMISEPSSIGYRDRLSEKVNCDSIINDYADRCGFFQEFLDDDSALNNESLITLKLSDECWGYIAHFEQDLEQKMKQGGELSHPILQRVVGKSKMQIMGLASNLYLLHTDTPPLTEFDDLFIPKEFVVMAIAVFSQLITGVRSYCERRGLISDVVQLAVVYNVFIGNGDNVSFSSQELKKKLEKVKPFKDLESPRIAIQNAIDFLVQNYVLLQNTNGKYFRNPEKFDRTYH